MGVDDAVLYMLHWTYSQLDEPQGGMGIMVLDFSSAFNTMQPTLLRDKLGKMGAEFVRLGKCVSGLVVRSTGVPQGTVLAPFLFTLYTADFKYNLESCHIQKYSDTAIVVGVRKGLEWEKVSGVRRMVSFSVFLRPRKWWWTFAGRTPPFTL